MDDYSECVDGLPAVGSERCRNGKLCRIDDCPIHIDYGLDATGRRYQQDSQCRTCEEVTGFPTSRCDEGRLTCTTCMSGNQPVACTQDNPGGDPTNICMCSKGTPKCYENKCITWEDYCTKAEKGDFCGERSYIKSICCTGGNICKNKKTGECCPDKLPPKGCDNEVCDIDWDAECTKQNKGCGEFVECPNGKREYCYKCPSGNSGYGSFNRYCTSRGDNGRCVSCAEATGCKDPATWVGCVGTCCEPPKTCVKGACA